MALFALLDLESEVQLYDKTRLSASKTFNDKASQPLNALTIKVGTYGTAIDVQSPNQDEWFLDTVYGTFAIDVDGSNASIIFNEGGSDITASLAVGAYTLTTYAAQIQTKMNLVGGQTYTVTANTTTNIITVSAAAPFQFKASPVQVQSFLKLGVVNTSHNSGTVEYGKRLITVTATNPDSDTDTKYFYQNVYTAVGDYLFSSDGDLTSHEPDILKWVPEGRSSFLNIHRKSQRLIMNWLDEKGYVDSENRKYVKQAIVDTEEVRVWSTYMTLRLIFQGLSNAVDDIFDRKATVYEQLEESARQRAILRLDTDGDGVADTGEGLGISSGTLFRR